MSAISRWRSCVFLSTEYSFMVFIHLQSPGHTVRQLFRAASTYRMDGTIQFLSTIGPVYQRIQIDINTCTHTHVELNRCIDGWNIKICNNFLTSLSYCVFVFLQKFQINSIYFSEFLSYKSVQSKPVRISSKLKQKLMYNRYIQGFWIKQDKDVYVHAYICIFIVCTKTGAPKKVKAWSRKGECYSQFSWRHTILHMYICA